MHTVYVAGPMRGRPHYNFQAFDIARDFLRDFHGFDVISPADLDRQQRLMDVDALPPVDGYTGGGFSRIDWHEVMRKDLALVIEEADMVAMLPGWQDSEGASVEVTVARAIGLPTFELDPALFADLAPKTDPEPTTANVARVPGFSTAQALALLDEAAQS